LAVLLTPLTVLASESSTGMGWTHRTSLREPESEVVSMAQPAMSSRVRWPELVRLDGERLRQLRAAKSWTQETFARKAGVSLSTVMRLEHSSDAKCRCSTATRLAKALGERLTALIVTPGDSLRRVAFWARWRRPRTVVADSDGYVVDLLPVLDTWNRPGPDMLRQTGWLVCPDSEWREDPPGLWSVPVFRYEQERRGGDEDDLRDSGC